MSVLYHIDLTSVKHISCHTEPTDCVICTDFPPCGWERKCRSPHRGTHPAEEKTLRRERRGRKRGEKKTIGYKVVRTIRRV
jgi:hypothetical protein